MSCLGNLLWMICGGVVSALSWVFIGCIWCVTIVGIPVGKQCFKIARLTLCPFGKELENDGGTVSTIVNILWIITSGIVLAAENLFWGIICCITIVGIPFGMQFFKIAKLSLAPFGVRVK